MKFIIIAILSLSLFGCGESAQEKGMREAAERRKENNKKFKMKSAEKPKLRFSDADIKSGTE